jgi:catechol 2,3-dioxygenase-like lactoylglutathione lyase family enzyme
MIDHLELRTNKMEESARFYADVLGPLGYRLKVEGEPRGFGDDHGLDLFLAPGEPSANVHFAFAAPSRALVESAWEAGREAGHLVDRAPALMPQIHASYFAGFFKDPDGRLVEIVCHAPE